MTTAIKKLEVKLATYYTDLEDEEDVTDACIDILQGNEIIQVIKWYKEMEVERLTYQSLHKSYVDKYTKTVSDRNELRDMLQAVFERCEIPVDLKDEVEGLLQKHN